MTTGVQDELLAPVGAESPCGDDLRFDPEWDALEALRGSHGKARQSGSRKEGPWEEARSLAAELLTSRSKDLRLGVIFTEASCRVDGFAGARVALELVVGLVNRYWDDGLHPTAENGDLDARISALSWYDEKFADVLADIPFTARTDGQPNYNLSDLRHARHLGWEKDTLDSGGYPIDAKRKVFDGAVKAGLISLDLYAEAGRATALGPLEVLNQEFREAGDAFSRLDKALGDKLGDLAPSLGLAREVLAEIGGELDGMLHEKRPAKAETDNGESVQLPGVDPAQGHTSPVALGGGSDSWDAAEEMVRSGKLDEGLALMSRLANTESRGRSRFHRKLQLAETCVSLGRERLARTILEELNEQIDKYHLDEWESPDLIGRVWGRLLTIYRKSEPGADRTEQLYKRLSHLDPWQVLAIPEE